MNQKYHRLCPEERKVTANMKQVGKTQNQRDLTLRELTANGRKYTRMSRKQVRLSTETPQKRSPARVHLISFASSRVHSRLKIQNEVALTQNEIPQAIGFYQSTASKELSRIDNEPIIVDPTGDPAAIKRMKDGTAALKQIVVRGGKLVDFRDIGSREVFHTLFVKSELTPDPAWLLQDTGPEKREILNFAGKHNAYCIVGSLPVPTGRMPRKEMIAMVEGDPGMRRPYVLMVANPKHFSNTNHAGAAALVDFLLKPAPREFIGTFGHGVNGAAPFFFPVAPAAQSSE